MHTYANTSTYSKHGKTRSEEAHNEGKNGIRVAFSLLFDAFFLVSLFSPVINP